MAGIQNSLNALITTLGAASMFGKNLQQREMSELATLKGETIPQTTAEVSAAEKDVLERQIKMPGVEAGFNPEDIDIDWDTKSPIYKSLPTSDPAIIESNVDKAKAGLLNAQQALEGKQAQLRLFEKRKEELTKKWRVK